VSGYGAQATARRASAVEAEQDRGALDQQVARCEPNTQFRFTAAIVSPRGAASGTTTDP